MKMSLSSGASSREEAGNPLCGLRGQPAGATTQACHLGAWHGATLKSVPSSVAIMESRPAGRLEAGELARWKGLLLNPVPVGFKPFRFWFIFELPVTDWSSQCRIFLNMHKAMESFHCIYDTLSCGTLKARLAS